MFLNRRLSTGGGQGGFAIVLALVVLSVLFAAAGGLALSRQTWGFSSVKQLDKALMESSVMGDSTLWFSKVRQVLENQFSQGQPLDFSSYSVQASLSPTPSRAVSYVAEKGKDDDSEDDDSENDSRDSQNDPGTPLFVVPEGQSYPEYPSNMGVWELPRFYQLPKGSSQENPFSFSFSDPFYGSSSLVYGFGVLFPREMDDKVNKARVGRFSKEDTQLRAWYSVDGAGVTMVGMRYMPLSQFTLFSTEDALGRDLELSESFLGNSSEPYSYDFNGEVAYAANRMGIGRVYVEGKARVVDSLCLGFPLVATGGYFSPQGLPLSGQPLSFRVCYGSSDSTISYSNFSDYIKWKGILGGFMVVSSDMSPCRLLRSFSESMGVNKYRNKDLASYAKDWNGYALRLGIGKNSSGDDVLQILGGLNFSQSEETQILESWLLNNSTKTLRFSPGSASIQPYYEGFRFSNAPLVVSVDKTVYDAGYDVSLNVPSVYALSENSENRRLTVISSGPLRLEGDFNRDEPDKRDSGTMIVAPRLLVDGGSRISGIFVTETPDPRSPFLSSVNRNVVTLRGGLIVWNRVSEFLGWDSLSVPVTLVADAGYISGVRLPYSSRGIDGSWEGPPIVVDTRVYQDSLELYKLKAVDDRGYKTLSE